MCRINETILGNFFIQYRGGKIENIKKEEKSLITNVIQAIALSVSQLEFPIRHLCVSEHSKNSLSLGRHPMKRCSRIDRLGSSS